MMDVEIVVRGEGVALARPRFHTFRARSGQQVIKAYNPAHVREWQSHCRLAAQQAMGNRVPLEGPLSASFLTVMPIPKSFSRRKHAMAIQGEVLPVTRPDVSNLLKNAEDAMLGIVYRDDAQIVSLKAKKIYGLVPRTVIQVSRIEAQGELFEETERLDFEGHN